MTTKVLMFLGVETYNWSLTQFQTAMKFLKAHNLDGAIVKVFDGPNEWYGGNFEPIAQVFENAGLQCIPYGFLYGNSQGSTIEQEAALCLKYLGIGDAFVADMENGWNGQGDWTKQFGGLIAEGNTGTLWVSTWAQIGDEQAYGKNWLTNIANLLPVTSAFLPQDYSNFLDVLYQQDWSQTSVPVDKIWPTFDLSQEDGLNNPVTLVTDLLRRTPKAYVTLWEYTQAVNDPSIMDQFIKVVKGIQGMVSLVKNKAGEVANFVRASQFVGQHSEFACGPAAVSHAKYATDPQTTNNFTQSNVQDWLFNEYAKVIGPDTISDTNGSSIANMEQMYQDAGFHYWELNIDANTQHDNDIEIIKRCLESGYVVIATIAEASAYDVAEQKNPYFWGLQAIILLSTVVLLNLETCWCKIRQMC